VPGKRSLQQVTVDSLVRANMVIRELMGRDSQQRFEFIMAEAETLQDLDV
jgi:DNA gyrase/topoisomerase IV subunit B